MHFSIPDTQELNDGNGSTYVVNFDDNHFTFINIVSINYLGI